MKVKVTKKMVQELNKAAKNRPLRFEFRELPPNDYSRFVCSDIFAACDYGDFDYAKNVIRFIAVIYPGEFYACNSFLTTEDLASFFYKGITAEQFCNNVVQAMEI